MSDMLLIEFLFCFKQKTAYEMRISDWSSDVCSSDLPLIDLALARLGSVGSVAVNVHHGRAMLDAHLDPGVHRSYEESLLGTAGALGQLRGWLDGRAALVVNGDAWFPGALDAFRSAALRVGKECVRTCRSRWSAVL